ncbi:hypothetical protein NFI96_015864, partial [Prochilodus magdalenae]
MMSPVCSDPDFKDMGIPKPLPFCEFEMGGSEGIIESQQITKDGKASQTEAVDCKWFIRAPPRSKMIVLIYLRFLDYEMQNSNECKRNFVAVYDGSSSVEDLKVKFCSTVASDVMLLTSLGVVRMWVDEGSRRSRFKILFTTFQEPVQTFMMTALNTTSVLSKTAVVSCQAWYYSTSTLTANPAGTFHHLKGSLEFHAVKLDLSKVNGSAHRTSPCEADTFFCHSNMCINNSLVCNGVQNCVYPWDENHCKEKRKANLLDNLNNTNGTIIGVTCCVVLILLVVSVVVQIKQPRKKYILRRDDFDPTVFQEVFQEPPHYELCTLRSAAAASADLAELAEDLESFHRLRRSSSRCIHDHHCGANQPASAKGSNLSPTAIMTEIQPQPTRPLLPPNTANRRSILVMKHSYSQDACELDDELDEVPTTSHRLSRHEKAVQRS